MPEYLAPGVYVEEVDTGSKPIEGVSTSTSGMVGVTERGPENVATFVDSFADFQRRFGGRLDYHDYRTSWYLPHAVEGFFTNGGKRLYVVRVLPNGATAAAAWLADTPPPAAPAAPAAPAPFASTLSEKAPAGSAKLKLADITGAQVGTLLKIEDGAFTEYVRVKALPAAGGAGAGGAGAGGAGAGGAGAGGAAGAAAVPGELELAQPTRFDHAQGIKAAERAPMLKIEAIDRGKWGDALRMVADEDAPLVQTALAQLAVTGALSITLKTAVGLEPGSVLEFVVEQTVKSVDTQNKKVSFDAAKPLAVALNSGVEVRLKGAKRGTTLAANAAQGATDVTLADVAGIQAGSQLEFLWFREKAARITGNVVTLDNPLDADVPEKTMVRTREFMLQVDVIQRNPLTGQDRMVASETHRRLALDPRHSRYAPKVIGRIPNGTTPRGPDGRTDGESDLIRVQDMLAEADAKQTVRVGPERTWNSPKLVSVWLTGGDDAIATISDNDYIGTDAVDPQDRSGLFALRNIEEVSIVAIPGRTSQTVQEAVINHCELMRYRCAVLDSRADDGLAAVQEQRGLYDTKYAALYYPWLKIPDPYPENPQARGMILLPPSGHVMGIYARSDNERGVHKAPANEVLRGIADLEVKLTKEQQDILNPRNINALRNFREINRGLRVWGARLLSSDPDWKYVNVRRLFIFIEHSIDRGTQWVVFEPNNEALWARVRRVITAFLINVWRDGALMGTTPEEAFFVKCDRTTMTQLDIDTGKLIVQIGLAVTKPAEFVIFRIGQWAGGSALEEA